MMVAETDGEGRTVTRAYDAFGRLESATLPTTPEPSVREASAAQTVGAVAPGSGTGPETNPAPFALPEERLRMAAYAAGRLATVAVEGLLVADSVYDEGGAGNGDRTVVTAGAGRACRWSACPHPIHWAAISERNSAAGRA